ncbi:unnamed protein product [Adineta steineri]|uniref:Uncharacterized protein n=1 Tax=Adineta steineri TaxID=433720 RepID=A0A819PFF1_9BILA|nr:unnamed protein product [Adineta steineri]CAF1131200.1 unnamed protein product [Adineta steineri]CAF1133385.1 unnamed protein product [Adineta steineri]CAF1360863.1 unnamed protein product [Adineta steineri]CAF1366037.1 unnamed protein product [Adineta steineri]
MWSNGYNPYGNFQQQQDAQPQNWFTQQTAGAMTNPFGMNYMSGATNPFAGQMYGQSYQPYNNLGGFQYRGW